MPFLSGLTILIISTPLGALSREGLVKGEEESTVRGGGEEVVEEGARSRGGIGETIEVSEVEGIETLEILGEALELREIFSLARAEGEKIREKERRRERHWTEEKKGALEGRVLLYGILEIAI